MNDRDPKAQAALDRWLDGEEPLDLTTSEPRLRALEESVEGLSEDLSSVEDILERLEYRFIQPRVEFDFPCSKTFRRYEEWLNGEESPDNEPSPTDVSEDREVQISGIGFSSLLRENEQLKGALNFLEGKLNEHIDMSKRKRKGYW